MESTLCSKHNKPYNIIDLTLSTAICERCAIFEPIHRGHHFIEADQLQQHSEQLFDDFEKILTSLNLVYQNQQPLWQPAEELIAQTLALKSEQINKRYDQLISQLQTQRQNKLTALTIQIESIKQECINSITGITKNQYLNLEFKHSQLKEDLAHKEYLTILKELHSQTDLDTIHGLLQQLAVIRIDLIQKLNNTHVNPQPQPSLIKKISNQEEMLIKDEEDNEFLDLTFSKEDNLTCGSNPQAKQSRLKISSDSFLCPAKQLSSSRISIDPTPSKTKIVFNKSEIKEMHIRSNVRTVALANLSLNNRQALSAIKKCTTNNFVNKIDLSHNDLNTQFLISLKRQKNQSKYLKCIVLKEIKLDQKILSKEGIVLDTPIPKKIQIGELTIEL